MTLGLVFGHFDRHRTMNSKSYLFSKSCDRGKLNKGPCTFEEDIRLLSYIKLHGRARWNAVAKACGLQRCGKSCWIRWMNYLRPDLKRGSITPEEERQISDLHARLGNRWSLTARNIPGRTDNDIKSFCRSHMRKRRPLPSSPCSYRGAIIVSPPKSNNCRALLDVPSNPAVSEAFTSSSMYQRTCEALKGSDNMDHYQVEAFLKCELDEVLSYSFPWPEQDAFMAFPYQLYLGTHDMSASNPYMDVTSESFHDLDVTDTLWNTLPSLHDELQMPPPQPQPEISSSHIQR